MINFEDLRDFFEKQQIKLIIVADGEPRVSIMKNDKVFSHIPAGGVAVALDPIAQVTHATYIARAKNDEEKLAVDNKGKMLVSASEGDYTLKRLFLSKEDEEAYYYGFSNQTLWPLCHVAFREPRLNAAWFEGYKKVNQAYAKSIKEELDTKSFIWIHDYQLALVPSYLGPQKDNIIAMFWHIPWPTWEVFRILPNKKEILQSMLACDYIAFHRGYHARNFLSTVENELETRIDLETQKVYFNNHVTTVRNLPLGVDSDVIESLVSPEEEESVLNRVIREMLGLETLKPHPLDWYFEKYKVIFGVDRLDYTKGIPQRLQALDRFFEKYPKEIGKVVYLGILAPSREQIPSYKQVRKEARELAIAINTKYETAEWKPIHLIHDVFNRRDVLNFYQKADLCVVTPLDDGMNLVSKEFVIASSRSSNPGMLVLSQFAGSSIDLQSSIIVNPYDVEQVADAIREGLYMSKEERRRRIKKMADMLEEKNVYQWAYDFINEVMNEAI